jgi:hypothetical protein
VKLERSGQATFRLTLHAYELATLTSAATWAAEGTGGELPPEARAQLRKVLADYEAQLARLHAAPAPPAVPAELDPL